MRLTSAINIRNINNRIGKDTRGQKRFDKSTNLKVFLFAVLQFVRPRNLSLTEILPKVSKINHKTNYNQCRDTSITASDNSDTIIPFD